MITKEIPKQPNTIPQGYIGASACTLIEEIALTLGERIKFCVWNAIPLDCFNAVAKKPYS